MATTAAPPATNGSATQPHPPLDPIAPDELALMTLSDRLAQITGEVGPVAKAGRNAHFGYSYQRAEDVGAAIAPLLKRYRVSIRPRVDHSNVEEIDTGRTTRSGAPIKDFRVPMVMRLAAGQEVDDVPWYALANDDSDKGVNKAITAGLKSFLRATFLVSTGDDDTDSTEGSRASAEGGAREWSGELPPISPGQFTGGLSINEATGDIGLMFKTADRDDSAGFDLIKDTAKSLPRRKYNSEIKAWVVPAADSAIAVAFARHFGLTVPAELEEKHPASAPAASDEPAHPMDLPPSGAPGYGAQTTTTPADQALADSTPF